MIRYLRQQMAIVAQTELLHKTLRENITYGMQTMPSDSEIMMLVKKLQFGIHLGNA